MEIKERKESLGQCYCFIQVEQYLNLFRESLEKVEQGSYPGKGGDPYINFLVVVEMLSKQCQQDQGNSRRVDQHQDRYRVSDDSGKPHVGSNKGK